MKNLNRMSKLTTAAVISTFFLTSFGSLKADTFKIDAKKSKAIWYGEKVVGSKHTGTIRIQGGSITVKKMAPTGGEFTIDMSSIENTDIEKPKWKAKLEKHLKSADFFDIKKFKTAKFVIKSVKKTSSNNYDLSGDLTIKGKTHPAVIKTVATLTKESVTAKGSLEFDRTKYGIRYGSDKFFDNLGDKMISDKVKLEFDISAKK